MEPLFESANVNLDWDGKVQRVSPNSYKQMSTSFIVRDKNGNDTHFNAGDYVMGNSQFVWGVTKEYFNENYKVLSKTVHDNVPADFANDAVCCDNKGEEK